MMAGYAGVQNPLLIRGNTQMLFSDAKDRVDAIKLRAGVTLRGPTVNDVRSQRLGCRIFVSSSSWRWVQRQRPNPWIAAVVHAILGARVGPRRRVAVATLGTVGTSRGCHACG